MGRFSVDLRAEGAIRSPANIDVEKGYVAVSLSPLRIVYSCEGHSEGQQTSPASQFRVAR